MADRKKLEKFLIIGILAIFAVVSVTYAFFQAQIGNPANTGVNVGSDTTDNLSFDVNGAISLNINQFNLGQGAGNLVSSAKATATLQANSGNNMAAYTYYVYFRINSNNFVYTSSNSKPEIILTVTDPTGQPVTTIDGLTYVSDIQTTTSDGTIQTVNGFDITTATGTFAVASLYNITANSSTPTVDEWNFTVSFINLETDQRGNTGKKMEAELIIQEDPVNTLAEYLVEQVYTGVDGENGLYLHDGTGTYTNASEEAGDNSYRFSGGDYKVTQTAIDGGFTKVETSASTDVNGVINFYCNESKQFIGYECEASQTHYYTTSYNEAIHYNTYEEVLTQAVNDGYLTEDNIKNFVCFGPRTNMDACPVENLYRIIGVFNGQVKLIKYDYADTTMLGEDGDYVETSTSSFFSGKKNANVSSYSYYWNYANGDASVSDWSTSRLNTINLNTNYWNYLGSDWQSKIANTSWQVGGNTYASIIESSVKTAYTNELVNPAATTTYQDEIGLIYISDYMYAVDPSGWQTMGSGTPGYNDIKGDNWMYMGYNDWTITHHSDSSNGVLRVNYRGHVGNRYIYIGNGVRPSFYLNSNVEFSTGSGTIDDPYVIV